MGNAARNELVTFHYFGHSAAAGYFAKWTLHRTCDRRIASRAELFWILELLCQSHKYLSQPKDSLDG